MLLLIVSGYLPPCCARRNAYISLACGKYFQWTLRNDTGYKRRFHYLSESSSVSSYFTSGSTSDYLWCRVVFLILQVEGICSVQPSERFSLFYILTKEEIGLELDFIKTPGIANLNRLDVNRKLIWVYIIKSREWNCINFRFQCIRFERF